MNVRPMRPDTVSRIRPCTYIRHDGKVRFVARVQLAPTKAHPERIRLFLSDLSGCLASRPEAIHLLAGDIVWQTWDPRIAGPTREDLAETDPDDQTIHGLRIGDTVHVICGRTNRRIEDISLAANEVKVDGYWVSADRIEAAAVDDFRPVAGPSLAAVHRQWLDRGLPASTWATYLKQYNAQAADCRICRQATEDGRAPLKHTCGCDCDDRTDWGLHSGNQSGREVAVSDGSSHAA